VAYGHQALHFTEVHSSLCISSMSAFVY
jgi:hypothetical protein